MFILHGSGLLGSGPTGPGSGYSVMPYAHKQAKHYSYCKQRTLTKE